MSLEEFKKVDSSQLPIGKLITIISKSQTLYLNHRLADLGINSTQLHLLFEISNQCNINQERIASRCNINKGAVARSIKKLEEKELIIREVDETNRRQNRVSLTKKGEDTLKKSIIALQTWENEAFTTDMIEKERLHEILKQIAINIIEMNERDESHE